MSFGLVKAIIEQVARYKTDNLVLQETNLLDNDVFDSNARKSGKQNGSVTFVVQITALPTSQI